jgi:hypothetical protein
VSAGPEPEVTGKISYDCFFTALVSVDGGRTPGILFAGKSLFPYPGLHGSKHKIISLR